MCDYLTCLQASLSDSIFPLKIEAQSGLDTKQLVRRDPRQMQQLLHAFVAPSLGTAALDHNL